MRPCAAENAITRPVTTPLLAFVTITCALWTGCAATPQLSAASDRAGVYVHAGNAAGDVRAGLTLPPQQGWPPPLKPDDGTCVDARKELEQGLAVASMACPEVQRADVNASANADQPIASSDAKTGGANMGDADQPIATNTAPFDSAGDADQPIADSAPQPMNAGDADQPSSTSAEQPTSAPLSSAGFNPICYDLGSAMLVVEYEHESTLCTRIVGLALFHKQ